MLTPKGGFRLFDRLVDGIMEKLRTSTLFVSALAIILMALMEMGEIISRSFFSFSFMIADEFAGYFLAVMVFMGLCNCYCQRGMVRVEVFYNLYEKYPGLKRAMDTAFVIIMLGYAAIVMYFSIRLNYTSFRRGVVSSSFLMTPLFIPQLFMPVGNVCFFLYVLLDTYKITIRGEAGR